MSSMPSAPRMAGIYPFLVGQIQCLAVSDEGANAVPPQVYGTNVPPTEVASVLQSRFLSATTAPVQVTVLYLELDGHRVLVDTGFGVLPGPDGTVTFRGQVRANLAAVGIAPDTIDTIVLSHLHGDHIGGLFTEDGAWAFPHAHYYVAQTEWAYWQREPTLTDMATIRMPDGFKQGILAAARAAMMRLADRVTLIDTPAEILPGLQALPAPGHTPGHTAFQVTSDGQSLLVPIDAWVHQIITPEYPDWLFAIDLDAQMAQQTRHHLLDQAANERALVLAYHFPWPSLGHVGRHDGHWRWEPIEFRWDGRLEAHV